MDGRNSQKMEIENPDVMEIEVQSEQERAIAQARGALWATYENLFALNVILDMLERLNKSG